MNKPNGGFNVGDQVTVRYLSVCPWLGDEVFKDKVFTIKGMRVFDRELQFEIQDSSFCSYFLPTDMLEHSKEKM